MMTLRTVFVIATALAFAVVPAQALAEVSSVRRDAAAAEVLFRAALEARDKGDWDVACAKFHASMDLDPAVATLINIAKCREHDGKLAAAWTDLNRALVLNHATPGAQRKKELETYTKGLMAALEPRISKLTIAVREKPAGLKILRDGVDVLAALGEPLPVDPGVHEIQASAPGFVPEKHTVTLTEGKSVTVELSIVSKRRVGAYVAGGVGVAGLVLGGVMGGVVLSKISVVDANCGEGGGFPHDPAGCTKTGLEAANVAIAEAKTPALISNIGFGVGAAGVVTAALLLVTERNRSVEAAEKVHVGIFSAGHEGATIGIWGAWQ